MWSRHTLRVSWLSCPDSYGGIVDFAEKVRFPVVAKNREAFVRRRRPAVNGTTRIATREGKLTLARDWGTHPGVILQEYLPREAAEDWIVQACFDADSHPRALFTGVEVRSRPPHACMTANACVVGYPELADLAARFIKQTGFTGIIDLDLRFDRRDGQYKLLDFNPRTGAQFRLVESESGAGVVRAMHLDLTGRRVPDGEQRAGHRYVVENIDLPAPLAYRRSGCTTTHAPKRPSGTELAWPVGDGSLPFVTMPARFARPLASCARARSTSVSCGAPAAAAPAPPRGRRHVS